VPGLALQDESSGGNDQEVSFRTLNARLIAKPAQGMDGQGDAARYRFDDDDPDFEVLPLAQIKRGGEAGRELDTSYIPPILAVDACPHLQRGILQGIYDRIGAKIEKLS